MDDEPIFSLHMGDKTYNVIVSPSMTTSIFTRRDISSRPVITSIMKSVFGDHGAVANMSPKEYKTVHGHLNLFLREPVVTQLSSRITRLIETETPNLVSFCRSIVDQSIWERAGNVSVDDNRHECEANLFALVREFVAHVTLTAMVGRSFIDSYPTNLLQDIWDFDAQFAALAMGLPRWVPIPGLSAAYAARARFTRGAEDLYKAYYALEDGGDPGVIYSDLLEEVCEPLKRRMSSFKAAGYAPHEVASADVAAIWAMVTNTTPVTFWTLLHILTDPTLLSEVREEIAPYVKVSRHNQKEIGSSPFPEPPQLSIDLQGVLDSCVLLKATYYETMRVDVETISPRELPTDVILTESAAEAALDGLTEPRSFHLRQGESVMIAYAPQHQDSRYFANPSKFDPHRFITIDPETGKKTADMGILRPFGGGTTMCKGRVLAEREILAFTAAILSMWDIEPADSKGWRIPGHQRMRSGALSPVKDIRVRLKYRI
jgi:hypothetical protein